MVLVDALLNLAFPNPTAAQLVPVAAFIEKNVARLQWQRLYVVLGCLEGLNFFEVQIAALDVRNTQVRDKPWLGIWLMPLPLRDATREISNVRAGGSWCGNWPGDRRW